MGRGGGFAAPRSQAPQHCQQRRGPTDFGARRGAAPLQTKRAAVAAARHQQVVEQQKERLQRSQVTQRQRLQQFAERSRDRVDMADERRRVQQLQHQYAHLVPFAGVREELALVAQNWGLRLRDVVLVISTLKALGVAALIMCGYILLLALFTGVLTGLKLLLWLLTRPRFWLIVCTACLLEFIYPIALGGWRWIWYFRQRRRLQTQYASCSECAICLADLAEVVREWEDDDVGRRRVLFCGHQFHEVCIASWLKHRDICPLCRA